MPTGPIRKLEVAALDKVGLVDGFDCPNDRRFKISETVLSTPELVARPGEDREATPKKAKAIKQPDEWAPCITTSHF
jgi:hypothetical protein